MSGAERRKGIRLTRRDIFQLLAWAEVVRFNNTHPVGSPVKLRTGEQRILTGQGFVLANGVPYIVADGVTVRLSEVDYDDTDQDNSDGAGSGACLY